jgi:hypothetical protein
MDQFNSLKPHMSSQQHPVAAVRVSSLTNMQCQKRLQRPDQHKQAAS